MNRHIKRQHLLEIEIFCNIMSVFIVTFGQSNASLLNKSIISLKESNLKKKKGTKTVPGRQLHFCT